MDVVLAKTVVEVIAGGSFVEAANRLNVTQSTVSTRIQNLEQALGRRLFVRAKSGVVLTPAGEQFHKTAVSMIQLWEQALHNIAVPEGFRGMLTIGGQLSFWDGLLIGWLRWMKENAPYISIRAEYGQPDRQTIRLVDGTIDLGIMYTAQNRPGLRIEHLFDDEFVYVRTSETDDAKNYVVVDWGPEFLTFHSLHFPELSNTGMTLNLGTLGLNYILANGGSGYFPKRVIETHVNAGRLSVNEEAPVFRHPVYVAHSMSSEQEILNIATCGLYQTLGISGDGKSNAN